MASLHQPVFAALAQFRASWPRRGWSYDNRFMCVASTFDSESAATARVLIEPILPHCWTSRTMTTAPRPFPEIAERTGGLRSTQFIFGADPVGRLTLYGLWWPWEEGRTISLRIGLEGASNADTMELCNAFGAELLAARLAPLYPAGCGVRRDDEPISFVGPGPNRFVGIGGLWRRFQR